MSTQQPAEREVRLGNLFVTLADTLVSGFDLSDLLHTLVQESSGLLDVQAAALFLGSTEDTLGVAAASTPLAHAVQTLILEGNAGPCIDAYRTGTTISVADISDVPPEWEPFARIVAAGGFHASHAVPMRLRDRTIGVLILFSAHPNTLSDVDAAVAGTIAHAATIALIQHRHVTENAALTEQLQQALDSRIVIEQAKGIVSNSRRVSLDEAFALIRETARGSRQPMRTLCARIVDGTTVI